MTKASAFVAATLIHSVTHICSHIEYQLYVIALHEVINTRFCNMRIFTLHFIHCLTHSIYSLNYLAIWYTCTTLTHSRTMPHRRVRDSLRTWYIKIEKIAKILVYTRRSVPPSPANVHFRRLFELVNQISQKRLIINSYFIYHIWSMKWALYTHMLKPCIVRITDWAIQ